MLEFVDAIMAYFAQIRDPSGREGAGIGSQLSVTLCAFETVDVEEKPNATTKPPRPFTADCLQPGQSPLSIAVRELANLEVTRHEYCTGNVDCGDELMTGPRAELVERVRQFPNSPAFYAP